MRKQYQKPSLNNLDEPFKQRNNPCPVCGVNHDYDVYGEIVCVCGCRLAMRYTHDKRKLAGTGKLKLARIR